MIAGEDPELDLVLVGATGFVGRLTARHLAEHAPEDVRIGLAGRSGQRLEALRPTLPKRAQSWPLLTVDVTDPAQAAELADRTRVVATTAGPYLRYGLALVQACAEAGTHYADLTGETLFVRRSIDLAHRTAQLSGARIVHSCGFDSVPSDLGVGLCAAQAAAEGNGELAEVVLHVRTARGGVSGGTIDSLRQQILETRADPSLRRLVGSAQALLDEAPAPFGRTPGRGGSGVGLDPTSGRWHAPFVMGGYNRQVVMRSAARLGYGSKLRYREVVDTGRGPLGRVRALATAAGSTALMVGMWLPPTRVALDLVLPDPGQGPSDRVRARGRFVLEIDAETTSEAHYRTRVAVDKDPGYGATAVMLGEAALTLTVPDRRAESGVLTPMIALGPPYAERLRQQGFTISTRRLD
ncbi:MAG TPA: saccharopine dehydrogenase NADP-binding domain-containing protein [Propionibacteriaceae bacterium]